MRIPLDRESSTPLYQQIEQFIRREINSGSLPPETRLPATRQLAENLGVNRITVANAYAGLEAHGLVYTRLGSGTYVAHSLVGDQTDYDKSETIENWPSWQQKLWHSVYLPALQERNRLAAMVREPEDLLSFAGGVGAPELIPANDLRKALSDVLRRDNIDALGYGDRAGYPPLRATITHILADQGILTQADQILVTTGSQQALSLTASLLLRPGDCVLTESPTYPSMIDVFYSLGVKIMGIPVDDNGMQTEKLEEILTTEKPSLIYTTPTYQNPTGVTLSGPRRRQLLTLAAQYDIPILEDEFVGDLHYEGHSQPALKALDQGGRVIYSGTFSKMLMPGLRLGYLVADGPVYDRLVEWKNVTDLGTSDLIQRALEAYITVGRYQSHLHRAVRIYRQRRDIMLAALEKYMPLGCHWHTPHGGLFIWLQLPEGLSTNDLYPIALQEKVKYLAGAVCYPGKKSYRHMRLNFTMHPPQLIEEGVRRLAKATRKYMDTK
ncbi:MAG: PLP-dependent aminotransferase family protein [Anaerolineales bacterium]|nr:PLP-dependent aminotransferase family protein [Anaerolineales bacterium]